MTENNLYGIYRIKNEDKRLVDISVGRSKVDALKNSNFAWAPTNPRSYPHYRVEIVSNIRGFKISVSPLEETVSSA